MPGVVLQGAVSRPGAKALRVSGRQAERTSVNP
jgi:hypothetical protein